MTHPVVCKCFWNADGWDIHISKNLMGDNYDVSKELIIECADKTIVLCASIFLNIIIKMYFYDQLENIDLQEQNST